MDLNAIVITEQDVKQAKQFATILEHTVLETVKKAFTMRAIGKTEDEILLDYDLGTCLAQQREFVPQCMHTAISMAVKAHDVGIPYDLCCEFVQSRVHAGVQEIIEEIEKLFARQQQQ